MNTEHGDDDEDPANPPVRTSAAERDQYNSECLTWAFPFTVPWMHVDWTRWHGSRAPEADGWTMEVRLANGRLVMVVIAEWAARKLLRDLRRQFPDEPLPPEPDPNEWLRFLRGTRYD